MDFGDFMRVNDTLYAHLQEQHGDDIVAYEFSDEEPVFDIVDQFLSDFRGYHAFMAASKFGDYYELYVFPIDRRQEPCMMTITHTDMAGTLSYVSTVKEYFRCWMSIPRQ
jgi:hypothetical protein